jgi:hypothetical protein
VSKAVAAGEVTQAGHPGGPSATGIAGAGGVGAQHRFPRGQWGDNVAWRGRALMALGRSWRERPVLSGPPDASGGSKR